MYTTLVASIVLGTSVLLAYMGLLALRRFTPSPVGSSTLTLPPVLAGNLMHRFELRGARNSERTHPARVSGLSKTEAEDVLDWMEATGRPRGKVSWVEGSGFTVSWN